MITVRRTDEKQLKGWENNRVGRLGDGTWVDRWTKATTVRGLNGAEVASIVAGGNGALKGHGLALRV